MMFSFLHWEFYFYKKNRKMSELKIKSLFLTATDIQADAEKMLESQTEKNNIATINWPEFSYKPEVAFRIGTPETKSG